jgi:Cu(I)/Ag(I) efflux system periplasmic protein CusF
MRTRQSIWRLLACAAAGLMAVMVSTGAIAQATEPTPTEGEVRKVDKAAGKITLRHGEIKNLDMPPMTMVFGVSAPALLEKVKPGDKVRFRATGQDGKYTVVEIEPAK